MAIGEFIYVQGSVWLMAMISFWCRWLGDLVGRFLRSFSDSFGDEIQSLVAIDEDGNQIATPFHPLPISGSLEIVQSVHDDLNANANIQVGTVDVDADNPVPIKGQPIAPTAQLNPSYALSYTNNLLTQVDMTIEATTYRKTHSYSDDLWIAASDWVTI